MSASRRSVKDSFRRSRLCNGKVACGEVRTRRELEPARNGQTAHPTKAVGHLQGYLVNTDHSGRQASEGLLVLRDSARLQQSVQASVEQVHAVADPVIQRVPDPAGRHAESITQTVDQVAQTVDETVGGLLP